jgi:ssRNA-specific RNase YbeY (16S rRNA maturation enzyme)
LRCRTQAAIEQLELDGPLAVKLAVESVEDLEQSESVELSVMLCGDAYIQELNKTWLGKDTPTDVLSFPQEQSPDENPTVSLFTCHHDLLPLGLQHSCSTAQFLHLERDLWKCTSENFRD